jgi:hypothetical protein
VCGQTELIEEVFGARNTIFPMVDGGMIVHLREGLKALQE